MLHTLDHVLVSAMRTLGTPGTLGIQGALPFVVIVCCFPTAPILLGLDVRVCMEALLLSDKGSCRLNAQCTVLCSWF